MKLVQIAVTLLLCSTALTAMHDRNSRLAYFAQFQNNHPGRNAPAWPITPTVTTTAHPKTLTPPVIRAAHAFSTSSTTTTRPVTIPTATPTQKPVVSKQEEIDPELDLAIKLSLTTPKSVAPAISTPPATIATTNHTALTAPKATAAASANPTTPAQSSSSPKKAITPKTLPQGEFALPSALNSIHSVEIHHLSVEQQPPASNQCGSRAAINALAIQRLALSNSPIGSTEVKHEAAQFKQHYISRDLNFDEVITLARKTGLNNAYILTYYEKNREKNLNPFSVVGSTNDISGENILDMIPLLSDGILHFICNTGGHWVAATLIKREDQISQIFFTDSCNAQLTNTSRATDFILFICATFLTYQ